MATDVSGSEDITVTEVKGEKHSCQICDRFFHSEKTFKKHLIHHTRDEIFECNDCNRVFSSKGNLVKHSRLHEQRPSYPCPFCNKTFAEKGNLKKHTAIHRKPEVCFRCNICEKTFSLKGNLVKHMNVHSKEMNMVYTLPQESIVTFSEEGCISPELLQKADVSYQCAECEMVFDSYSQMKDHRRSHIVKRKPLFCDICSKIVHGTDNLARHKATHIGEKPFQCLVCEKSFSRKDILKSHMKIHDKDDLKCTFCEEPKMFLSKKKLNNHIAQEHQQMDREMKRCKICEKQFQHYNSLRRHMHMHSDNVDSFRYTCDKCEMKFYRKDRYVQHTSHCGRTRSEQAAEEKDDSLEAPNMSESEVPASENMEDFAFQCHICENYFSTKVILKSHLKMHNKNNLQCSVCEEPKTFLTKKELNSHVAEEHEHMDTETNRCKICRKQFQHYNSLRRHMYKHSINADNFKYSCDDCERKFYRKDKYMQHTKNCKGKESETGVKDTYDNQEKVVNSQPSLSRSSENEIQFQEETNDHTSLNRQAATRKPANKSSAQDDIDNIFNKIEPLADNKDTYKCDICEKEFNRKSKLERHVHCHRISCNRCQVQFTQKEKITVAVQGNGKKVFLCKDCVISESGKKSGDLDESFTCSKCKMAFKSKEKLTKHLHNHRKEDVKIINIIDGNIKK